MADEAKGKFAHSDGDHTTLLNVYHAYKRDGEGDQSWCSRNFLNPRSLKSADDVRSQLQRIMERSSLKLSSPKFGTSAYYTSIKQAMISGYFMQAAHLERGGTYLTVKDNQVVRVHPSCVLDYAADWVIYHEFVLTSQHYIRTVTAIKPEWLLEIAPAYYDLDRFPQCEGRRVLEGILMRKEREDFIAERKRKLYK